jgi:hypothetical protein
MKSKGSWRWCVIICKSCFLDFVHHLYFNKITTFRKLDRSEASSPGGPKARVSVLPFLPEDGRRSSFRNYVILLKYRRWTESKKTTFHILYSLMPKISSKRFLNSRMKINNIRKQLKPSLAKFKRRNNSARPAHSAQDQIFVSYFSLLTVELTRIYW